MTFKVMDMYFYISFAVEDAAVIQRVIHTVVREYKIISSHHSLPVFMQGEEKLPVILLFKIMS